MPLGKTNNPEGKNQYTNGGGAAFKTPSSGKNRPKTFAGAGRGSTMPDVHAMMTAKGIGQGTVQGGRGNYNPDRVDPYAAAGKIGASLGGKAEAAAVKAKGAISGAMAGKSGGLKGALEGAKQGATKAELNFAETSRGAGAAKGEKIARKVAEATTTVRSAAVSATQSAKDKAEPYVNKAKDKAEPYVNKAKAAASNTISKIKSKLKGN